MVEFTLFSFEKCIACEVCVRVCPIDLPVVDWRLEKKVKKKRKGIMDGDWSLVSSPGLVFMLFYLIFKNCSRTRGQVKR